MQIYSRKIISILKMLSLDMINEAEGGYPSFAMNCSTLLYELYANILVVNPDDPKWLNRDRIVFSSSFAAPLVYSTLYMSGFNISKDDLKNYGKIEAKLSRNLDYRLDGIDASVGAPGEGICTAIGMALAEQKLEQLMNINGKEIINYMTYVVCGKEDIMSGISHEALSYLGLLKIDKFGLIIAIDENDIKNNNYKLEKDLEDRLHSYGFNVYRVSGENAQHLKGMLNKASYTKRPTAYIVTTTPGKDIIHSRVANLKDKKIDEKDLGKLRKRYDVCSIPFEVSEEQKAHISKKLKDRCKEEYNLWKKDFEEVKTTLTEEEKIIFDALETGNLNVNFNVDKFKINDNYKEELRKTNLDILSIIGRKTPLFVGGSTDYDLCNSKIKRGTMLSELATGGKNVDFSDREEAMCGILNGLALCNFKTFSSTTLAKGIKSFPAIKLSSLMSLPTTHIFVEDNLFNNRNGAMFQAFDEISSLRNIKNNIVFRPADINELFGVWDYCLKYKGPTSIVLSNNVVPKLDDTNAKFISYGGYVVKQETNNLDAIIIATGSEVHEAINIAKQLEKENINIRVVSMPSIELFLKQNSNYQKLLLPKEVKRVVIEPSNDFHWLMFATDINHIIGIKDNGESGHFEELKEKFGFTEEQLLAKVKELIVNNK